MRNLIPLSREALCRLVNELAADLKKNENATNAKCLLDAYSEISELEAEISGLEADIAMFMAEALFDEGINLSAREAKAAKAAVEYFREIDKMFDPARVRGGR